MKALWYPAFDQLTYADRPDPSPAPGEAIIEVAAVGVCGSELETFRNRSPRRPPPLIMGHEFCGTVVALGAGVTEPAIGSRVISHSVVPCGTCPRCMRGNQHLCANRQIFGMHRPGAFAQRVSVPAHVLFPWPAGLAASAASLTEPLANGIHIVNLTRHLPADDVLVIGAGPIGLMCQQAFQTLRGSRVMVADLAGNRLAAATRLGAARGIRGREEDPVSIAREATGGEGVDLVVDAVGAAFTKGQSLAACRAGGAAVWIGLHENTISLNSYDLTLPEKQVLGTYAASMDEMRAAVELLASGRVDGSSWVSAYPLAEGVDAFRRLLTSQEADIKAVLLPNRTEEPQP